MNDKLKGYTYTFKLFFREIQTYTKNTFMSILIIVVDFVAKQHENKEKRKFNLNL